MSNATSSTSLSKFLPQSSTSLSNMSAVSPQSSTSSTSSSSINWIYQMQHRQHRLRHNGKIDINTLPISSIGRYYGDILAYNHNGYMQYQMNNLSRMFINTQNKYKTEIEFEEINKRNIKLNIKLNNLLQEKNELKHDFDKQRKFNENLQEINNKLKHDFDKQQKCNENLQEINNKLRNDVDKLIYFINERNEKSLQLIDDVKKSKDIINSLTCNKNELNELEREPNINQNRLYEVNL